MRQHMSGRMPLLAILAAFLLTACGDDDDPTLPDRIPQEIEVSTLVVAFDAPGESHQVDAVVRDQLGDIMVGATIEWSSADESVATVSFTGLIEAVGPGETVVTASHEDLSVDIDVSVPQPVPTEIHLEPTEHTFSALDETVTFTATVLDENGEEIPDAIVDWASSDENVVTIDTAGEATAVAEGTATITATTGDAVATAEVSVEVEI